MFLQIPFGYVSYCIALISLVLVCAIAPPLRAQDTSIVLDEVQIRADGVNQWYVREARSLAAQESLDSSDLDRLKALQLGEVVQNLSGTYVKDYGGLGGLKSVSVRSLGAGHTGVFINGVRVSDVQSGIVDLGRLNTENSDRVVLSKSFTESDLLPASALRVAAVLQLQSNAAEWLSDNQYRGEFGVKTGSFGLIDISGSAGVKLIKEGGLRVGYQHRQSQGAYPYISNELGTPITRERKNADIRSSQVNLQYNQRIKEKGHFSSMVRYYSSQRGLPGATIDFNPVADQRMWNDDFSTQLTYEHQFGKKLRIKLFGDYSQQWQRYLDPSFLNSTGGLDNRFQQSSYYGALAWSYKIHKRISVLGASDFKRSNLKEGSQLADVASRNAYFQYVGFKWSKGKVHAEGRGLFETFQTVNDQTKSKHQVNQLSPALAIGILPFWKIPLRLRASYQRTLRMPTFSDLFYFVVSNPDLVPERANQLNFGLIYSFTTKTILSRLAITLDGYHIKLDDKIIAIPTQNLGVWSVRNIGQVETHGVDVGIQLATKKWHGINVSSRINYTFQRALDVTEKSSSTYRNQIPYTPREVGNSMVTVGFKMVSLTWTYLFSGYAYVLGENLKANAIDGWSSQDLALDLKIKWSKQRVHLFGKVNNIFDERYAVIRNFPMPGRFYQVGIKVGFEK